MNDDMTKEKIEEELAEEIESETPEMLDDLLSEIEKIDHEEKPGAAPVPVLVEKKQHREAAVTWYKMLAALAAVLIVFVGARSVLRGQDGTFAVVGIDVNPSIELSIDKDERVIGAKAVNNDGEELLKGMKLEGSDVSVACNAIIGAMVKTGYLTDKSNSMLISVYAKDSKKGRAIEHVISEKVNEYFEGSEIAAAIIGQYFEDDKELEEFAEKNGISAGKALLIRKLLEAGKSRMTEESLLKLSTQELILLAQQKEVPSDDSYGKADTSKYIGEDKAVSRALKKAGLTKDQADGLMVEFDCEDGTIIYEVEFTSGGAEYEYEIDAATGRVISFENEAGDGKADDVDDEEDDDREEGDDPDESDEDDDDEDDSDGEEDGEEDD